MQNNLRPKEGEFGSFYKGYIEKVGNNDIFGILKAQMEETTTLFNSLTPKQAEYRYADGKWSFKEVIGHLIDSERVFAYRGMCFARGEQQALPGFDQDAYVKEAYFDNRSVESLRDEYIAIRNATIVLFRSFSEEMMKRSGTASGNTVSVRALLYIIAGHERHHLDLLETRYNISQ